MYLVINCINLPSWPFFLKKNTTQYAAELDTKLKQGHIFEVLIFTIYYSI